MWMNIQSFIQSARKEKLLDKSKSFNEKNNQYISEERETISKKNSN